MENILSKIRSVKLCLMAHPDNIENSEFADCISNLEYVENELSGVQTDKPKKEDFFWEEAYFEALKKWAETN